VHVYLLCTLCTYIYCHPTDAAAKREICINLMQCFAVELTHVSFSCSVLQISATNGGFQPESVAQLRVRTCTYVYIYNYILIYTYSCTNTYTYIHIHTYIHQPEQVAFKTESSMTYIHTYTYVHSYIHDLPSYFSPVHSVTPPMSFH